MRNEMGGNREDILREHITRRILNSMMGMFTGTHGQLWGIHVCGHSVELMAEHGSYAGSCSLWKPFGAYLIAEKGTLLSTVCLFVWLWWYGTWIAVYWTVCVFARKRPCARTTWLSSWTIALCGLFYMEHCLFKRQICSIWTAESKCRRKLQWETIWDIWILFLQTHTTRKCPLYLHESTVWVSWTWFALNGDMQLYHLIKLFFWLVSLSYDY